MLKRIATLAPIMQLAYVPRSIEDAVEFWTKTMGVGPFFHIPHVSYQSARYFGQAINIDFSMLIGYWGEMQIELIEQHCDSPSIYKSWRDERREGLHHTCIIVDDLAAARTVFERADATIMQEITLEGGGAFYADTGGGAGSMVEVLKPIPGFLDLCDMMKAAANGWDGSDPVRPLG